MINEKLDLIIMKHAPELQTDLKFASAVGVLKALAKIESTYGTDIKPRYEKEYAPGGKWCNAEQKNRYNKWGDDSCKSYSSFQILYTTACELGFDKSPWDRNPKQLGDDEIAIIYVIEYIKRRILQRGVKQLEGIADAYNSGRADDNKVPISYIRNFILAYNTINKADYVEV